MSSAQPPISCWSLTRPRICGKTRSSVTSVRWPAPPTPRLSSTAPPGIRIVPSNYRNRSTSNWSNATAFGGTSSTIGGRSPPSPPLPDLRGRRDRPPRPRPPSHSHPVPPATAGGRRRLFSAAVRALLQGHHPRLSIGQRGEVYVAGVDVAGQDDAAVPGLLAPGPTVGGRDSTVVDHCPPDLERRARAGNRDRAALRLGRRRPPHPAPRLRHLLAYTFPCVRVAVDATGLGAGVASWLAGALGGEVVESFVFNAASKSKLASPCWPWPGPAVAGSTGPTAARRPPRPPRSRVARYELAGHEQLRFFVPASDGHDDYLMSLASAATPPWAPTRPQKAP